jgi:hypothetical protein
MSWVHLNNIFNIQLMDVSNNGSVNFGDAIIEGSDADSKGVGGQSFTGDRFFSIARHDGVVNVINDPDVVDQQQNQI